MLGITVIIVKSLMLQRFASTIGRALMLFSNKWLILVMAVISGFFEELIFRGILQNWVGVVLARVLFVLSHMPQNIRLILFFRFPFGLAIRLALIVS